MLVTMNEVLQDARKAHYAVGLFNAVTLELAQGIIDLLPSIRERSSCRLWKRCGCSALPAFTAPAPKLWPKKKLFAK